jgi:4-hydroxybenzoate polyprenyltransferase
MTHVALLVRACHPEPTAAVTAIAAVLAASVGADPLLVGAAFLTGQLSVGWSNDWVDAARDRVVRRTDKPTVRGLPIAVVRNAAITAAALCVPLSLALGWRAGVAHLVAVVSAWLYNLRLKSTAWSFAPYALSFGLVPSVVTLASPEHGWAPWWATLAGALLGLGAHGANVLPDMAEDVTVGVVGLPHRLGRRITTVLAGALLVLATVVLAVGPGATPLGWVAVALSVLLFLGGLAAGKRPGSRAPFLAVIAVAAVDVGLLMLQGGSLTPGA